MIARASMPPAPQIDAGDRFLREIATRIAAELIAEIHLFPPIRQGGMESGVAVVAARNIEQRVTSDGSRVDDATSPPPDDTTPLAPSDSPYADDAPPAANREPIAAGALAIERFIVYTAFYRLVLKGPDRGKWEFDAIAEADAPLEAVSAVVRGVQRRSGELQDAVLLIGDAFRAAIGWTPPEPEPHVAPDAPGIDEPLDASAANASAS